METCKCFVLCLMVVGVFFNNNLSINQSMRKSSNSNPKTHADPSTLNEQLSAFENPHAVLCVPQHGPFYRSRSLGWNLWSRSPRLQACHAFRYMPIDHSN